MMKDKTKPKFPLVPKLLNDFPVTYYFVLLCIVLFAIDKVIFLDIAKMFAINKDAFFSGQYYRVFTHIFVHQDFGHISGNLLYIVMLLPFIEYKLKFGQTISMIFFSAVLSGILLMLFSPNVYTLGASGIIFTLMGMYVVFIKYMAHKLLAIIPLGYILLQLGGNIFDNIFYGANISIVGHFTGLLIGLLMGLIYIPIVEKNRKN